MAGYIFSLNDIQALKTLIQYGVYSTNLSHPKNNLWKIHHEGTFADYFSMKAGDNVYFFIERKIYGIGELVNIHFDCKFLNYPEADIPTIQDYKSIKNKLLLNQNEDSLQNRFVCTFKPSPFFFEMGIDMDDVLASNPKSFRMLRAFWKLSFIKIDDEENKALRDIILKRNEQYLNNTEGKFPFDSSLQKEIATKLTTKYTLSSNNVLLYSSHTDKIKHEMAVEAHIVDTISRNSKSIFGSWDYVSHQVIASPFKPIDYMDKMDVFGYRFIPGFDTISKYLLIEIKKDSATKDAIDQIMKYVDWINQEYTFGDYSMIHAFLVAYDFSNETIAYRNEICKRNYTKGRRPTIADVWENVRLIKYRYNPSTKTLDFEEV
ncbi:hypothetical protein ACIQ4Z_08345 [Peribacillus asahii]|uniref:hypothetical protein n=1 Tax=Peribacillus asahii TaxID=228899 RepID=UPI00381B000D